MAAKVLSGILAAAMIINSTQTACASTQADFDVEIEEEIFLEEEVSEEEAFEEESDDSADSEEIVLELPEDQADDTSVEEIEEFILTEEEIEVKEELIENDVLSDLLEMEEGTDYVEDQVITLASDREEAQKIAEAYGGELLDYSFGLATISLEDSDFTVVEAFEYGIDPDNAVPAVEPDYLLSFEEEEAGFTDLAQIFDLEKMDPYLSPKSTSYQWQHEILGSYDAWDVTLGSSDIIVAVIDSGVKTDHEDLADAIVDNIDQVNQETYSIGLNDSNEDGYGHGTHVAGLVAASFGNGLGGAGVAPGTKILPINVCKPTAPSSPVVSYMVKAIQYVAGAIDGETSTYYTERRADIINMSIGSNTYNAAMKAAVEAAYAQGVTIVAAMGNDGTNLVKYPARYDHVIGVCATRKDNTLAYFSNYGSWADISAPGEGIYSTTWNSKSSYGSKDGTSMASPIVAGACALYMSYAGHVSPDTMEKVLKSTATKISQSGTGAGIVNVARMLGKTPTAPAPSSANIRVKSITLDKTAVTLSSPAAGISEDAELSILNLFNTAGEDMLKLEAYQYTTFRWTSSNENVVKIYGNGKGMGLLNVSIIPVSAGSATVTCQVLDGSGKKATCKVKVVGNKKVNDIALRCDMVGSSITYDDSGKVKTVVLYKDAQESTDEIILDDDIQYASIVLYAEQTTKDGDMENDIKAPVFKNSNPKVAKVDYVDDDGKTIKVTALSRGSTKIKATAADGSGKSTTITVTVKQPVTGINVSGQNYIEAGSKASFTTQILPADADNKKVSWEVGEDLGEERPLKAISGVTVSSGGVVTVAKTTGYSGDIYVRATSLDDSDIFDEIVFRISPKATSISLYNPNASGSGDWTVMMPVDMGKYKSTLTLVGAAYAPGDKLGKKVGITTSNPQVVSIEKTEYDTETGKTTVSLRARKQGKATITCTSLDGSKKSSKVNLTVLIPVSGLNLTVKDNQRTYVAYGGNITLEAAVGKAFGEPSNQKIEWDYDIVAYKEAGGTDRLKAVNPILYEAIKNDKAFFEFSKGKIKVNSSEKFERNIQKYGYGSDGIKKYKDFGIIVSATAADGSGFYKESSIIRAIEHATYIDFYQYNAKEVGGKNEYTLSKEKTTIIEIDLADKKYNPTFVDVKYDSELSGAQKNVFALNSSNTSVASGYFGTHSSSGITGLIIYPYKVGKTSFKVAVRDGSGFSRTLVVKVVDSSKK